MTPKEILKTVLAMSPDELTAKVAEVKGLHEYYGTMAGIRGRDGWQSADGKTHFESDWSPPTNIADAVPLLKELDTVFQVDIVSEVYSSPTVDHYEFQLMRRDERAVFDDVDCLPFVFDSWDEISLAITRAYTWWKWCGKENS